MKSFIKKSLKFNSNISWSKSLKSFVKKSLKFNSNLHQKNSFKFLIKKFLWICLIKISTFLAKMVHFFPVEVEGICKSIYEGVWTNPYNLGKTPLNSVCVEEGGGGGGEEEWIKAVRSRSWLYRDHLPTINIPWYLL